MVSDISIRSDYEEADLTFRNGGEFDRAIGDWHERHQPCQQPRLSSCG
ncbi:hypothetical protein IFVP22_C230216 [Vibrio parahaemolyticus]